MRCPYALLPALAVASNEEIYQVNEDDIQADEARSWMGVVKEKWERVCKKHCSSAFQSPLPKCKLLFRSGAVGSQSRETRNLSFLVSLLRLFPSAIRARTGSRSGPSKMGSDHENLLATNARAALFNWLDRGLGAISLDLMKHNAPMLQQTGKLRLKVDPYL